MTTRHTLLGSLLLAGTLAACGGGSAAPSSAAPASVAAAKPSTAASASAKPAASAAASAKPAASGAASASAKPAASGAASAKPAASGGAASGSAAAKPAPSLVPATTVATLKITPGTSQGSILTDDKGKALYSFDEASTPASKDATKCTAGCLTAWPPLLSSDAPTAPAGLTGKFGVITRTDFNVKQVTYNDMPLYYFIQDTAAGDAKGQNSKGFGGNWQVIKGS